ncbi:MAG: Mov34/MPN/PAD-1 family protein, partial [Desulfotomaculales bacterium]
MSDALQLNLFGEATPVNNAAKNSSRKAAPVAPPVVNRCTPKPPDAEPPKDRPWIVCYSGHQIPVEHKPLAEILNELQRVFPELSPQRVVWDWDDPPSDQQQAEQDDDDAASADAANNEPKPLFLFPFPAAGKKGLDEAYVRGFHWSVSDMLADPRPVHVLAARDGLYEVRKTPVGIFSRRLDEAPFLDEWSEGFQLNFPRIPAIVLVGVLDAFQEQLPSEAVAYICWYGKGYIVIHPPQEATPSGVHFRRLVPQALPQGLVPVVEMHSHGNAPAFFSNTDDSDELATGLYAVVGRVGVAPEIRV